MKPERWKQVDELLERALEREPERRGAFLDQACAGDEELRREVESLLTAHEQAGSLLSAPAFGSGDQKSADALKSLMGQRLSYYEILSRLGEGGMGIVYKARDHHLDRFVAIKVLPPELLSDPDRQRRFVQEAKAASALNHPNIITIYDIANENGRDFIVMEHVAGKTLDRLIPRNGMKLPDALKIAIPMADALTAAHAAGIVHRDLKPGNVMVGDGGQVKILDFGLAKLTHEKREDVRAGITESRPDTARGILLGTAAYMSPEQAEGKPVDGSLESKETKRILSAESQVAYTSLGYLLFIRDWTLMAQPFDAERLQLAGEASPVGDQLMNLVHGMKGGFTVSETGALAYFRGGQTRQLTWFNRRGEELEPIGVPGRLQSSLAFSGRKDCSCDQLESAIRRSGRLVD